MNMHHSDSYREQALKLFPWVCGRCGRDFSGKQLRELTVHHKDHNHSNNPPDGSNWELLCIYCHDNEHQRYMEADAQGEIQREDEPATTHKGLAGLKDLLKNMDQ
ncbi:MAG: YajD family HNH nuclease [Mariprofundus sp.]|nr:YajD family HNH nuclease [Mariprofundus sp.]